MKLGAHGALAATLLGVACGPQRPPAQVEMDEHFLAAMTVYRAVLAGDLERARAAGRELSEWEASRLPAGSDPLASGVRRAARVIAEASGLEEVARAAGPLAQRCVACHEAYGVYARLRPASPPPSRPGIGPHMVRHQWALDRLWEGLITGSDDLWASGLARLDEPPADVAELARRGGETAARLGDRVHELAADGHMARTPAARTALFGGLLGTCVECHEITTRW